MCLSANAIGKTYSLYAERPGPERNARLSAGGVENDLGDPSMLNDVLRVEQEASPIVTRVSICGPITQRSEAVDPCGGFTEGHDVIAARLIAALEAGDVLLVFDTPGGACAGGQQAIADVLAAKALHGRRITGWADELCASMGFWWASCVCDEIFIPIAGAVGSIGARSSHGSIAGALAQAGIVPTFMSWPNEGKIAGVAELPLSDVGRERIQRDVNLAGEDFAAAVAASPYGIRHGLTREVIIGLSADCLTGNAAVAAGLADGVSSFREVQEYALTMATTGGSMPGLKAGDEDPKEKDASAAEPDDAEPKAEDDKDEPKGIAAGEEPSSDCQACGMSNEPDAKFCDQCGTSMAAKKDGDVDDEPDAEPVTTPDPEPGAIAAPKAMNPNASLAAILGATSESIPAIKTAAIKMRHVFDTVVGVTGKSTHDAAIGALLAVPSRLAKAAQVVADRKVEQAANDRKERLSLCKRGIASGAPEMTRGKVYRDIVGKDGKRTGVALAPQFAEMKLGTLRGLVEGLEGSAPKRNPFEADRTASEAQSGAASRDLAGALLGADGKPTAAAIAAAKKDPTVITLHERTGGRFTLDQIAAQHVRTIAAEGGA